MKNVNDLRKNLASVFEDLKNGDVEVNVAKEMNNAAGKIINTCKVQLEYQHLRGSKPSIAFLNAR